MVFFRSQKQMFLFGSHLLLGDVVGFSSRGEIVVAGRGNLNNCTFSGWVWVAFDPRETRGRPAKNTRESGNKGNLNNRIFWGWGEGVFV